jgi:hypothetical protein
MKIIRKCPPPPKRILKIERITTDYEKKFENHEKNYKPPPLKFLRVESTTT